MKVSIVAIGNSRGLRLPKAILDACRFTDAAELTVENGRVVLTPISAPRGEWAAAFVSDAAGVLRDEDREWLDAPPPESED